MGVVKPLNFLIKIILNYIETNQNRILIVLSLLLKLYHTIKN